MAEDNQWYFAYGSNMLSDVFVTRRKVQPLRSEVASINTHTLCFNVMGVPYTDPAMGGIRPIEKGESKLPVYGVAYLLTMEDMRRVIISEGGGIAYETRALTATLQNDGTRVKVITLLSRHSIPREYERLPSRRYMDLLIRGAAEHSLPANYQKQLVSHPTFQPLQTYRYRTGKWLFDSCWQRVAFWIQRGIHRFKDNEGNVPGWFLIIFDCLLWTMWVYHDYIHSAIWGRGDGLV
ncbi:hypothetical protein P175DRAFT_0545087 [Aspergillus ochraceoroseus IBT 24754]|uniref:gamma-glutamylcyclotransferase n=2 Tax=Aspergillus ochraceoroseus TaxID=138278 RepID=A0A2T5LZB8_9EURO|nr:uncharacterized protein P175DRAFT_0545087 [Aspergillus ochraceoroseus IBT 24754]KKK18203.1 hypothetical protein AOCH_001935 [Aspergillus ochraceoroseus]PTU21628.1 hypothetical protein P175DRAFT_0545087 [Aspergillus ochraceoroseus IBT 24754]